MMRAVRCRFCFNLLATLFALQTRPAFAFDVQFSESVQADIETKNEISPADPPTYVARADSAETAARVAEQLRMHASNIDYSFGRAVSFSSSRIADTLKALLSGDGAVTIDRMAEFGAGPTRRTTLIPFSRNARRAHNVPQLSNEYSLSGKGIGVAIWDQGSVLATHVEFDDRIELRDSGQPPDDHATQVAGTIAASGNKEKGGEPDAEGIAPASKIYSFFWKDDIAKLRGLAQTDPAISITNHSYSVTRGWSFVRTMGLWGWYGDPRVSPTEDYRFGKYDLRSSDIDEVIADFPRLTVFVAAGNNRNPLGYPKAVDEDWTGRHWLPILHSSVDGPMRLPDRQHDGGYDTLEDLGVAKNVITIGAMEDIPKEKELAPEGVVVTGYSNWGPTDDGRIKPDLVANGADLRTPIAVKIGEVYDKYAHGNKDGTSMASPTAAGIAALLDELSIAKRGKPLRGDEMKAVLVATAVSPTKGPTYRTGWGAIDALAAGRMVSGDFGSVVSLTAGPGQTKLKLVRTVGQMRVTMVWIDPPGVANIGGLNNRTPTLTYDFDLSLVDPTGKAYFPWSLDVEHPARDATNSAPNHRDNVERIDIDFDAAPEGVWFAQINAPSEAIDRQVAITMTGFRIAE